MQLRFKTIYITNYTTQETITDWDYSRHPDLHFAQRSFYLCNPSLLVNVDVGPIAKDDLRPSPPTVVQN